MFSNVKTLQNLKSDISLNGFLPSETTQVWVPELVFENTVRPHIVHDIKSHQYNFYVINRFVIKFIYHALINSNFDVNFLIGREVINNH